MCRNIWPAQIGLDGYKFKKEDIKVGRVYNEEGFDLGRLENWD